MKKKNIVKKEISEFQKFIARGNVVDMAVGVIIGGAFGKIVTSLVNDILMPLIGTILGGLDFTSLHIQIQDSVIAYGSFIQSIVDFLIIAVCIFTMIKLFERFKHEELPEDAEEVKEVEKSAEVVLLEEIRDLLKKENNE